MNINQVQLGGAHEDVLPTSNYHPDPRLLQAVLAAILGPLPFPVRMAMKVIPTTAKERVVGEALKRILPLSLEAIASTQKVGARMALTKAGELTEEVKHGFVKRIALWLIPGEVTDVTDLLQAEIVRLGREKFSETSWRLDVEGGEVVLLVTGRSFIKQSADTVVDIFFNSFESLKGLKEKVLSQLKKKE